MRLLLQITLLSLLYATCNAQSAAGISKPVLELADSAVIIHYDILESTPEDKFTVSVVITDSVGKDINANSFSGYIGKDVEGGAGKKIIWDFLADHSDVNEMLYFQVMADKVMPEQAAKVPSNITKEQTFNRGGLIVQSILLPGMGLTRLKQKPHWIKGVLGYGAVASSVVFYNKSNDNYTNYLNAEDPAARDNYYTASIKQESLSYALLYSAIGAWTVDFLWTLIGTREVIGSGTGEFSGSLTGLTAGTTYYVKAYATNNVGTAYGETKSFTTAILSIPTVTTAEVISITRNTAVCGGNVTNDGGSEVTARGIIWGTEENPSPSFDDAGHDGFTENGTGMGEFTSNLTNLSPLKWYYVRAWATNSIGTAYGEIRSFVSQEPVNGNIMKIHNIMAQPGDSVKVGLEILNEAEFVGFNLDIALPEGFEYIADSEELFRSDDHMLSVAVLEGNILRIISGSQENNPYSGNEGIILSFDMESTAIAGTYVLVIQNAVIGNSDAVNILTETVDGTVVLE
ncbi:MAG: hypothetical protein WD577_04235 [Bacteroidales bacterium]